MFLQATATLLLFAFLLQAFSRSIVLVNYYTHRQYIAENLCENRDKPSLNCCGNCYLKKKLNKEHHDHRNTGISKCKDNDLLPGLTFYFQPPLFDIKKNYCPFTIQSPVEIAYSFIRPPAYS